MECLRKVLDISNAHITEEEMSRIEQCEPVRIAVHEHGAIVFLPGEIDEDGIEQWEDFPNLLACVRMGIEFGCMLINFDSDAAEFPGLPKFEW